jgi:copper chaperone CopZ
LPALCQALGTLPGVQSLDFSLERKVAVIDFDPKQSHLDDFLRAVLKAGFRVS